jgi:nicotinate-nucleotide adenylyltransferase
MLASLPMDTRELQALIRRSHDTHFQHTAPRERLRDLAAQVSDLVHQPDPAKLPPEVGDVAWSLLQLCNELGLDVGEAALATSERLERTAPGKKVALIGVSANPITNAHLTMGLEILALTDVDEVWYLVVGEHAWGKRLMPAEHRVEMVRRAVARYPRLKASDFEVVHAAAIYARSRETSHLLREHLLPAFPGHQFAWVMGSDVAQTFDKWGGADWMAENLRMFVIHRLGYDFDKAASPLASERHQYLRENIVTSNISSTLVRERGRSYEHEKLLSLVPDVVWDYLVEHRLLDPDVLR